MKSILAILNNRKLIFEGFMNNLFRKEHVEEIAEQRMSICRACPFIDRTGDQCAIPGTAPCCSKCGCSLKLKTRSLSSGCGDEENPKWDSIVSQKEEDEINVKTKHMDEE